MFTGSAKVFTEPAGSAYDCTSRITITPSCSVGCRAWETGMGSNPVESGRIYRCGYYLDVR